MVNRVGTQIQTPKKVLDNEIIFVVPSYQRPFVWGSKKVEKLLDDIIAAQDADEPKYYIGTILAAKQKDPEYQKNIYELIDGQQRITTLVLIALALGAFYKGKPEERPNLANIAIIGEQPRLTFAIRDEVQNLLGHWASLEDYTNPGETEIEKNAYLTSLDAALKALRPKIERLHYESKLASSANFIYENVQWVFNTMPAGMDTNHLFTTMNTSGIQLEQTDILKSHLLKQITTEKALYEAIWQACEDMEDYFERNVNERFAGNKATQPEQFAKFDRNRFNLSGSQEDQGSDDNAQGLTIAELVAEPGNNAVNQENTGEPVNHSEPEEKDEAVHCRSIIGFPLLLMHALRIYRHEHDEYDIRERLHHDRLIRSFEETRNLSEPEVKEFFELLWKVRYQFDRWVVKWIADEDEEHLSQTTVDVQIDDKGTRRFGRNPREISNLVQLQSVRYFTGERSAQYWLTPFLGNLIHQADTEEPEVLDLLEKIDNQLSLTDSSQKEESYSLLSGDLNRSLFVKRIEQHLNAPRGTSFEHYWFQKLEYILWKKGDKHSDDKLKRYRIVSRNSVEHVHSQHEEYNHRLEENELNSFGNLALLNRSQNSSYGNQTTKKKKDDFEDKPNYDALKLKEIFDRMENNGVWDIEKIKQHQSKMLELIVDHYNITSQNAQ